MGHSWAIQIGSGVTYSAVTDNVPTCMPSLYICSTSLFILSSSPSSLTFSSSLSRTRRLRSGRLPAGGAKAEVRRTTVQSRGRVLALLTHSPRGGMRPPLHRTGAAASRLRARPGRHGGRTTTVRVPQWRGRLAGAGAEKH
jgi:hypothetical protein